MTKIYDQFDAATKDVSAYAITKDGANIGRIIFKYPRDGMGRLFAYVQVWGFPMVRGYASGCGYDKHSAAVESAVSGLKSGLERDEKSQHIQAWQAAMAKDAGVRWDDRLRAAGYEARAVI